jgi:hypothetical protein
MVRVSTPSTLFDRDATFDPGQDFQAFLVAVPAKWVVYLMTDADDRPVQLLCVKNLRASLKRRLGGQETVLDAAATSDPPADVTGGVAATGLSRRVDYRQIVRRVYWRRVDSAFESDVAYLEAARAIFPQTYQGMVGFRPAWFVHVNPETTYPRYTKTVDPVAKAGTYFGPLEDKHAAQKLVHTMENLFDLCRDYSILTQSPHGGPCAWRQMNKCVGPCDGSVSLDAYRDLVAHSAAVLSDPESHVEAEQHRMKQAAAELDFEAAARIKAFAEQLGQLRKGPYRHVRRLEAFRFVSLQRGPRSNTAKVFLITPGAIEQIACLVSEPAKPAELLRHALALSSDRAGAHVTAPEGVERLGVVAHHLFQSKQTHGVFLPLFDVDEKALLKAFRDLQKQKVAEESEGEGVLKELQAL